MVRSIPLEAWVWGSGLVALYLITPEAPGRPDLCPFHRLGLGRCPGCGLGASIHDILHARFAASWASHPLGIPALAILLGRIYTLLRETAGPRLRRAPDWMGALRPDSKRKGA